MMLNEQISLWREEKKTIVFTNGVFDILHVGHVTYLDKAKSLGDILVVGINSDFSVKQLNKGPERPINKESDRRKIIESLKSVDLAIIFSEETPFDLIQQIKPDVLVKGADYDPSEINPSSKKYIIGSDIVKKNGGQVHVIDLVEGFSSTNIINRMRKH